MTDEQKERDTLQGRTVSELVEQDFADAKQAVSRAGRDGVTSEEMTSARERLSAIRQQAHWVESQIKRAVAGEMSWGNLSASIPAAFQTVQQTLVQHAPRDAMPWDGMDNDVSQDRFFGTKITLTARDQRIAVRGLVREGQATFLSALNRGEVLEVRWPGQELSVRVDLRNTYFVAVDQLVERPEQLAAPVPLLEWIVNAIQERIQWYVAKNGDTSASHVKVISECESTDSAIAKLWAQHPMIKERDESDQLRIAMFAQIAKIDNGDIRERIIGTREMLSFNERNVYRMRDEMSAVLIDVNPMKDVPNDWIVMNASRPLVGNLTIENSDIYLRGRFYAAIDPSQQSASALLERNRWLDASVVMCIPLAEQREMAVFGHRYLDRYRSMSEKDQHRTAGSIIDTKLRGKTYGELRELHQQAMQAAPPPQLDVTPAPPALAGWQVLGVGDMATALAESGYHPFKDVPDDWIVMNASRPLVGQQTATGSYLEGRHYAAIDPHAFLAAEFVASNRANGAVMVMVASREARQEMVLLDNEYRSTYLEMEMSERLEATHGLVFALHGQPYAQLKELLDRVEKASVQPASPAVNAVSKIVASKSRSVPALGF